MKQKNEWFNGIIKLIMSATGGILLIMLLGRSYLEFGGQVFSARAAFTLRQKAADGLELLWIRNYPVSLWDTNYDKKNQDSWLSMVFNQYPWYRYLSQQPEKQKLPVEQDPSYIYYLENNEFYQEHDFLLYYGNEESDLESAGGKEPPEQVVAAEEVAVKSGESVITVREQLPVLGKTYLLEQLADYDFLISQFYSIHSSTTVSRELMNAKSLLSKDFKLEKDQDKPQILIYHTHSQERYSNFGMRYPDGSVVGVGNYLTELLEAKGYKVIHDTSLYDLKGGELDRNKAYTYALEGITEVLQNNPSIEVILDIHRDGVREGLHLVSEVNGKATAPIMFFNGVSQTPTGPIEYLPNPYKEDNLAFSLQMQLDAAAYYPGLTRKIYIKGLRYNQHLRPRSALVEVGAQTNSYEEALNAMEPLSELLDMVLQGD